MLARLNGSDRSLGESLDGEGMFASILDEGLRPAWAQARQKAIQSSERLRSLGADVLTIVDPSCPQRLKDLLGHAAPPVLTILGNADLLTLPGVGFCRNRATPRANVAPVLAAIRERASGSMQRPGRGSAPR